MSITVRRAACVGIVILAAVTMSAVRVRAQTSSSHGSTVVELYTSQGCSSCPPADRLLGELSTMPHVIALAFHVDYWDSLGWHDRFSIPNAVERQRGYVQSLDLSSAFTPQVIINGRNSVVGSDKRRILAAISDAGEDTVPIQLEESEGTLTITLPEIPTRTKYTIFLAAYLPQASTRVERGENSGTTLEEFNIVRQFRALGTWTGRAEVLHIRTQSVPPEASHVAVFVQAENQGPIAGGGHIAVH